MGFISNTALQVSSIKSANNVEVASVSDSTLTVNGAISATGTQTSTITNLSVNSLSNVASTGITWENPFIYKDGKKYKIEFRRYEYPQTLNGLKAWIDLNDTDCWDRNSKYIECLVTRRKFWGSSQTTNGYSNHKNSHFVSSMFVGNVLSNQIVMRTDHASSGSNSGLLYCYEQRPEWGLGTSAFTMIAWMFTRDAGDENTIISQQQNIAGSNYFIWRVNSSNWGYYDQKTNGWSIGHGGGNTYPVNKGWCMVSYQHDPANYRVRQYVHSATTPNGSYVEQTSRMVKANLNGTIQDYQMRMEMGASGWNPSSEGIGHDTEGYLGPVMLYNRALTENEMTGLFDYYKGKFTITAD